MAKFFVGQRVRLVRPFFPENAGCTGTIMEFSDSDSIHLYRRFRGVSINCLVRFDGEYKSYGQHTDQLEPLAPPHIPGSWEAIEQLLPNIREGVAA